MSRPPRPRTTTTRPPYVTLQQLSEEPERATVVTLRGVLDVTTLAPVAAHPLLLADDWSSMPDRPYVPPLRLAHRILKQAERCAGSSAPTPPSSIAAATPPPPRPPPAPTDATAPAREFPRRVADAVRCSTSVPSSHRESLRRPRRLAEEQPVDSVRRPG